MNDFFMTMIHGRHRCCRLVRIHSVHISVFRVLFYQDSSQVGGDIPPVDPLRITVY